MSYGTPPLRPPATRLPCSVCKLIDNGSDDRQLQPYGDGDALICYGCMMARENGAEEYTAKFIAACQKATDAEDARRSRRATSRTTTRKTT